MENIIKTRVKEYQRIEQLLRDRITSGEWPVGYKLPGRRKLAEEFEVALPTLERALAPLVYEGQLSTSMRSGTFVLPFNDAVIHKGLNTKPNKNSLNEGRQEENEYLNELVGIVVSIGPETKSIYDLSQDWYNSLIGSLEKILSENNICSMVKNRTKPDGWRDTAGETVDAFLKEGATSLVIIALFEELGIVENVLQVVDLEKTPTVFVLWDEILQPITQVFYDNVHAGYRAARHLLSQGCTELIYAQRIEANWSSERLRGACEAIQQAGLPDSKIRLHQFSNEQFNSINESILVTENSIASMFKSESNIPGNCKIGIIAAQDDIALQILPVASKMGLEAGRDYAILGFDDTTQARFMGISSMRPPLISLGEEAANLIIEATIGHRARTQVRLCSQLIKRRSSALIKNT